MNDLRGHPSVLREAVLNGYVSSSSRIHYPLDQSEVVAFCRAHRYYLKNWLDEPPRESWLDLGCGQGLLMCLAHELGYSKVMGIDTSKEMLQLCTQKGLRVVQCDIFEYLKRSSSQSWQVVSAFDILEHFPKDQGFLILKEVARILKPNGCCFVKIPNAHSPWGLGITANDLTHEAVYTSATITQMARLAGFPHSAVREIGPVPHSFTSAIRRSLWSLLRFSLQLADTIETGASRTPVYSRVMLVRLWR